MITPDSFDLHKETSLFRNHSLPAHNIQPVIHITHYDYLSAGILFISFILFVWLYVSNRKRLNQIIKGFYINRFANQLAREEFSLANRVTVLLTLLFVFTLTLFITNVLQYYGFGNIKINVGLLYFLIGLSIIIIYAIKYISIKLAGSIFQAKKAASDYILTIFLFCNSLGLFMFPLVICLLFVKQVSPRIFIYIGFFIIVFFICSRIIRGVIIGLATLRASKFYLFLYLCTLEIVPFFIMIKLFSLLTN